MSQERLRFRVPNVKFRVLIVGRANAGKTSILQRVCETTESPKIYRVRGHLQSVSVNVVYDQPSTSVAITTSRMSLCSPITDGYVFHDSCGFEAGHEDELRIVQDFVREKATARRLQDRLHAIWFVKSILRTRQLKYGF
ncbi:hypothetical protein HD554DRAFT_2026156 [Boletus coccyginus]|nr:hypothetical protein HD554DRAFT_2026156 [Boletus coccyginus]